MRPYAALTVPGCTMPMPALARYWRMPCRSLQQYRSASLVQCSVGFGEVQSHLVVFVVYDGDVPVTSKYTCRVRTEFAGSDLIWAMIWLGLLYCVTVPGIVWHGALVASHGPPDSPSTDCW